MSSQIQLVLQALSQKPTIRRQLRYASLLYLTQSCTLSLYQKALLRETSLTFLLKQLAQVIELYLQRQLARSYSLQLYKSVRLLVAIYFQRRIQSSRIPSTIRLFARYFALISLRCIRNQNLLTQPILTRFDRSAQALVFQLLILFFALLILS